MAADLVTLECFIPRRRLALATVMMVVLSNPLLAVDLPRGTLWRVEQTCLLNAQTTGSPFPCLEVNRPGGYAVLRAPFRTTHIVTMPIARVTGIEDPQLQRPGEPSYFAAAWSARRYVQQEVERSLSAADIGLAVNSRFTRSQDQLHIHVDCVRNDVRRRLAPLVGTLPNDRWQPAAFSYQGQTYAGRRLDAPDLTNVNVFALVEELPEIRQHPARTVVAVLGAVLPTGTDGFVMLVGQSVTGQGAMQSTSEDLLDHACRRPT